MDRRILELDGLRGLAAITVVVAHYFGEVPNGMPGVSFGWMGVNLFFVLSGFLIGSIILEHKTSSNFFAVFYVRRAARILPVYFVTLGAVAVAAKWGSIPPIAYVTFTQNFEMAWSNTYGAPWLLPTWTLAVEEQFYLLTPVAIMLLPKRWLLPALISGIIAGLGIRSVLQFSGHDVASQVLLPARMDVLLCGVLAAYFQRYASIPTVALRIVPLVTIACVVAAIPFGDAFLSASPFLMAALFASYILLAVRGWPLLRFMGGRRWRFFGSISYALYLFHQPVAWALHGVVFGSAPDVATLPQVFITFCAVALSVSLAALSWVLMEMPILNRARGLTYARADR